MGNVVASRKEKATAAAAVITKLAGDSIGEMIDKLAKLRDKKRDLEAKVSEIEGEYKGIEEQLVEKLQAEGTDTSRGKLASCSISASTVANVTDWDALFAYVKKTGHFHLFQRRITDASYRELLESGKKVPGVEPFIKKRLNLRAL